MSAIPWTSSIGPKARLFAWARVRWESLAVLAVNAGLWALLVEVIF